MHIIQYQAGRFPGQTDDDFEVMLESTANLYAAVGPAKKVQEVNTDIAMFDLENFYKWLYTTDAGRNEFTKVNLYSKSYTK